MHNTLLKRFLYLCSDNRKSKTCAELSRSIQKSKMGGLFAIFVAFTMCGAKAQAQQPGKVPQIGFLTGDSPSAMASRAEKFRQGLRDLGYVEGKNIVIEWRSWEGKLDRQRPLAAELCVSKWT